jgi:hypothetical protein
MAIYHKGKELSNPFHGGKSILEIYHMGKSYINWLSSDTKAAIRLTFGEEATQVIKSTNAYLKTIASTDKQRAKTLTNFINEDPLLVTSLVETSKTRWLVTDGDAAINIDYVPTQNSHIRSMYKLLAYGDLAQSGTPFGAGANWRNNNFECLLPVNNQTTCYFAYGNTPHQFTCNVPIDTPLFIDANKNHWTWTNLQTEQVLQENVFASNITISQPNGLGIFWGNRGGAIRTNGPILAIAFVEEADGAFNLTPFIHNGENGMLDIISGTFYPNANTSGAFTIELTDK